MEATIVAWSDTTIEAGFGASPKEVTVNTVFGSATSEIGGKPGKDGGRSNGNGKGNQ